MNGGMRFHLSPVQLGAWPSVAAPWPSAGALWRIVAGRRSWQRPCSAMGIRRYGGLLGNGKCRALGMELDDGKIIELDDGCWTLDCWGMERVGYRSSALP